MDEPNSISTTDTRQLRERKKPRYDFDDSSSEDDSSGHLRRASRRKSSGPPSVRRNKRSGKLASFVSMPLDVLHEIFGHLHPYDLLRLTRTTKEFRRILLHKSSISTWKTSFEHVSNLPPCPPEMCEPAWANLAFSPHCHYCPANGIRHVEWKFRVRICSKCCSPQLIEAEYNDTLANVYYAIPGGLGTLGNDIDGGLATFCKLVPNREGKRYKRVFLRDQLVEFRDKLQSLNDPEDKAAYLESRLEWIQELNMHAANCEAWAHNQADDRVGELNKLRKDRRDAIVKKLEELGYKKDVQFRHTTQDIGREAFANKPQRLTERIWKNVKPMAIEYIENVRKLRLQAEHNDLVLARKRLACEYLKNYKNSRLPCTDIFPEPPDFCDFDPVRRIYNQPSEVVVDLSSFNVLNDTMPDLIKKWRKDVHSGIRNVFLKNMTASFAPGNFDLPEWTNDEVEVRRRMSLATTVFTCEQCSTRGLNGGPLDEWDMFGLPNLYDSEDEYFEFDDKPRSVMPMFYPQIMAHPCLTRFVLVNSYFLQELYESTASKPKRDPSIYLDNCLKQRRKWNGNHITLDKHASKVAEKIVTMAGLDPVLATTEDMDTLDARFKCHECTGLVTAVNPPPPSEDGMEEDNPDIVLADNPERYAVLSWRAAVKHQVDRHVQGINPGSMLLPAAERQPVISMDNLHLLDRNDPCWAAGKEKEALMQEEAATVWCCALCRDTPQEHEAPIELGRMKHHLKLKHKLDNPVLDRDYYKHFAAKDLMNVNECVPWVA
ncbi:hypothetical protein DFP72DRAFT_379144 [Ephemerocybe angulata]|uniref:F-box domain-containing protein n=1 Tax=Ephemerocybe angulata TaxID=980116 RepID=A0A8H6HWG1_9AGAR|nr:hypothetical protein DFP72DRAFT_379144 [Tulosesus angulatus]